jgi:hypothetical protein
VIKISNECRLGGVYICIRFISRKEDDMTTQHHKVITKILVSAAIALGAFVGAAAPASADPNAIGGTHPNPFGGLSCNCQETAPPGSSALEQMKRGIRDAAAK